MIYFQQKHQTRWQTANIISGKAIKLDRVAALGKIYNYKELYKILYFKIWSSIFKTNLIIIIFSTIKKREYLKIPIPKMYELGNPRKDIDTSTYFKINISLSNLTTSLFCECSHMKLR